MYARRAAATLLALAMLVMAALPAVAESDPDERSWYAGKLDFNAGVDYRSGDYGRNDDTDILFVPFSLRYRFQELPFLPERDEFRIRLSMPYIRVEGPERGNASPGSRGTDDGVGDLGLRLTYLHRPSFNRWARTWLPNIYLSEKIKFPTASESKNLGSGEFDFTTGIALRKHIRLRKSEYFRYLKPFVTGGYKVAGEPSGESRNNSWRFGAGSSLTVTKKFDLGFRYSFRESTIPGRGDFEIVSPYFVYKFTPWLRVTPYAIFGVSTRSPDWGTGLTIRLTQPVD